MMKDNRGLPIVRVRLEQYRVIGNESVNTQDKAVEYIIREFADLDREVFMILNLDTALRPINLNVVSMGTLNESNQIFLHPGFCSKSASDRNNRCFISA